MNINFAIIMFCSHLHIEDVGSLGYVHFSLVVSGNKERVVSSDHWVKECLQPLSIVIPPETRQGCPHN